MGNGEQQHTDANADPHADANPNPNTKRGLQYQGHPGPEVSPHFFLRDQALGGPGGGRRCAHGARFKVIKPEKSADHARQRSIAEVPV
ncbi:hypothetical protein XAB3213_570017 [Xanthomonas citri pv. bilvae]|nr:hypothetical protein XAB3213_570017 [Xanthomonas citri pv. bilvae]